MSSPEVRIKLIVENGQLKAKLNEAKTTVADFSSTAAGSAEAAKEQMEGLTKSIQGIGEAFAGLKEAALLFGGLAAVKHMAEGLIEAQIHLQQIRYTLQAATGSAEKAGEEFEFIADSANRLGSSLEVTAESYGVFLVSAKSAHVTLQDTHDLFNAVSEAATVFHLSTDKMHSAMLAIEQMMGQGTIKTQELRYQLGNALPGAYENFMNAVNASGVDFQKAMASGELSVKKYSKVLAQAIKASFTDADVKQASEGINAELNRLKNAFFLFKNNVSGGLFEEAATVTVKQINTIVEAFQGPAQAIGPFVVVAGLAGAALVAFGKATSATAGKIQELIAAVDSEVGLTDAAVQAKRALTAEQEVVARSKQVEALATIEANEARVAEISQSIAALEVKRALAVQAAEAVAAKGAEAVSTGELAAAELALKTVMAQREVLQAELTALDYRQAAANQALAVSEAEVAAATHAAAMAQKEMSAGSKLLGGALGGLKSVASGLFAMLGGWPGILLAAGGALVYLATRESDNEKAIKALKEAYDDLNKATEKNLDLRLRAADTEFEEKQAQLADLRSKIAQYKQEQIERDSGKQKFADRMRAEGHENTAETVEANINKRANQRVQPLQKEAEALEAQLKTLEDLITKKREENAILRERGRIEGEIASAVTQSEDRLHQVSKELDKKIKNPEGLQSKDLEIEKEQALADIRVKTVALLQNQKSDAAKVLHDEAAAQKEVSENYDIAIKKAKEFEAQKKEKGAAKDEKEHAQDLKELAKAFEEMNDKEVDYNKATVKTDEATKAHNDRMDALKDTYAKLAEKIHESKLTDEEKAQAMERLRALYDSTADAIDKLTDAEKKRKDEEGRKKLTEYQEGLRRDALPAEAKADLDKMDEIKTFLKEAGLKEGTEEWNEELKKTWALYKEINGEQAQLKAQMVDLVTTLGQEGIDTLVDGFFDGFDKIEERFDKMLENMLKQMIKAQLLRALTLLANAGANAAFSDSGSTGTTANGTPLFGPGHASGGLILGPGNGKSDSIPVRLSNGEYVIQSDAVKKYGIGFLNAINEMDVSPPAMGRRYAAGGLVGDAPGGGPTQVVVNNHTGQPARAEEKTGPDGARMIEVIVGKVAADIRSNGPTAQALQDTFGVNRKGVKR